MAITLVEDSKTFNSVKLTYDKPDPLILNYTLRYKETAESVFVQIQGIVNLSYEVSSLESNTSYDFEIDGINVGGSVLDTGSLTLSTNPSSATITTQNTMRFEGFNESKYENQDLVDMTFYGGDQLILMANCESDLEKYGYNEKFDLWGNLTQEFTAIKKPITLNISDMTDAQHQLLSEHWVAQSPIKIKDDTDKVYHNLLILGKNLGLKKNTDVDGDIFWTGTLQLRQI